MTSIHPSFPHAFLAEGFFSFARAPYAARTHVENNNYLLFKAWCKNENYCTICTLDLIVRLGVYDVVEMDDDLMPNCPYCDSYYYEEYAQAKKNAATSIAKGRKKVPTPATLEPVSEPWMDLSGAQCA